MPKKSSEGFQSQAGLVRYLDTKNDESIKLSPKSIIIAAIALGITITIFNIFFPAG